MACTTTKTGKLTIDQNVPSDCSNYYTCPNIKLVGGVDEATAKVGVPNTVTVTVFNASSSPINNVHVEAWVCDYTMGVSSASSLSSSNPSGFAMTGFVSMIGSGSSAVLSCLSVDPNPPHNPRPWTPTAADAALNGGHVCIAANCYGDQPDDGGASGGIFNFCCDAHHAQRNIAVVAVGMKQLIEHGVDFSFFAGNTDPERPLDTVIHVRKLVAPDAFGLNERQILLSEPYIREVRTKGGKRQLVLKHVPEHEHEDDDRREDGDEEEREERREHERPVVHLSRFNLKNFFLEGDAIGRGNDLKLRLAPGEQVPVRLGVQFNPHERTGGFHVFDATQTNLKGEVVGGVRILTIITP